MNKLERNFKSFEDIKHLDEEGNEYWYAREFMRVLKYSKWQLLKNLKQLEREKNKYLS